MELVITPQVQGSSPARGSGGWGRSEPSLEQPEGAGSTEPSRQAEHGFPCGSRAGLLLRVGICH